MFKSAAKLAFAASIISVSGLTSAVYAADMVESSYYAQPRHVVTTRHVHHVRYVPVRATRVVHTTQLDCGPVIYDYRTDPSYTVVKTVCSGPWTKPSVSDY